MFQTLIVLIVLRKEWVQRVNYFQRAEDVLLDIIWNNFLTKRYLYVWLVILCLCLEAVPCVLKHPYKSKWIIVVKYAKLAMANLLILMDLANHVMFSSRIVLVATLIVLINLESLITCLNVLNVKDHSFLKTITAYAQIPLLEIVLVFLVKLGVWSAMMVSVSSAFLSLLRILLIELVFVLLLIFLFNSNVKDVKEIQHCRQLQENVECFKVASNVLPLKHVPLVLMDT